jgi:hypothetical protein
LCWRTTAFKTAFTGWYAVVLCWPTGAFITQVLPVMWLGDSLLCMVLLVSCMGMMGMHLTAYLQDPGYTPLPDAGEARTAKKCMCSFCSGLWSDLSVWLLLTLAGCVDRMKLP